MMCLCTLTVLIFPEILMICSHHILIAYVAGLQKKKQGNENGLTKLILRNLQFRHIIMSLFNFLLCKQK